MERMTYHISKTISAEFDEAAERVIEALAGEGFGILSDIDVRATLKKKLDVDFPDYRILGACNPPLAYRALQSEARIGTMLPCNVIVRDAGEGKIEVSAVDPAASMQAVDNSDLAAIATDVRDRLRRVVESL